MKLELNFRPTIQIIAIVRRSVMTLYERHLGDADTSGRVALATQEMLENVFRHSVDGDTSLHIRAEQDPRRVVIETRNRATPAKIAGLKAQAAAMAAQDPESYYLSAMTECANRDDDGGLGLARIYAEAEMTLQVESEGDSVHVVATTKLGAAA